MIVEELAIADIGVEDRIRPVDDEHAKALAFTIESNGLLHAITVRFTPAAKSGKYTLVSGATRLRAFVLLGRETIPAVIVKADKFAAVKAEIDENLFRNDLSVIDRAASLKRFREIWEEINGPIRRGGQRAKLAVSNSEIEEAGSDIASLFAGRFSEAVADRLGFSESVAKRLLRIAINLHPALREVIRFTSYADNESMLLKLAKLAADDQVKIAAALREGSDLDQALSLLQPHEATSMDDGKTIDDEKVRAVIKREFEGKPAAVRIGGAFHLIAGLTPEEKKQLTERLAEIAPPTVPLLETVTSGKLAGLMVCLAEKIEEENLLHDDELINLCKQLHLGPEQVNVAIAIDADWRTEAMTRARTILNHRALENTQGNA